MFCGLQRLQKSLLFWCPISEHAIIEKLVGFLVLSTPPMEVASSPRDAGDETGGCLTICMTGYESVLVSGRHRRFLLFRCILQIIYLVFSLNSRGELWFFSYFLLGKMRVYCIQSLVKRKTKMSSKENKICANWPTTKRPLCMQLLKAH